MLIVPPVIVAFCRIAVFAYKMPVLSTAKLDPIASFKFDREIPFIVLVKVELDKPTEFVALLVIATPFV